MSTGASPKIEEFDIEVDYESAAIVAPPAPPAAPRLVILIPEEYHWGVDHHTNRPGVRILAWPKGGRR